MSTIPFLWREVWCHPRIELVKGYSLGEQTLVVDEENSTNSKTSTRLATLMTVMNEIQWHWKNMYRARVKRLLVQGLWLVYFEEMQLVLFLCWLLPDNHHMWVTFNNIFHLLISQPCYEKKRTVPQFELWGIKCINLTSALPKAWIPKTWHRTLTLQIPNCFADNILDIRNLRSWMVEGHIIYWTCGLSWWWLI